jgi:hypothetical protein
MEYLIGIGCSVFVSAIIAFFWVRGIDYMKENHPDYNGEDLFGLWDDENDDIKNKNKK